MSSGTEDDSEGQSWVDWFCRLKGHEFFCEVGFNLMPRFLEARGASRRRVVFLAAGAASLILIISLYLFPG